MGNHLARITALLLLAAGPLTAQQQVQFESSDGHQVYGYWYAGDQGKASPLIVAFNQGGADARSEYAPIVPRLRSAGFELLAVDARAGGERFGGRNLTVESWGEPRPYCEAQADVEGALDYANRKHDGPIVLWGSSFSAALVLRVAARRDDVAAVLAFSPASGGPLAGCRGEEESAGITAPVLVLRPAAEAERAAEQLELFRAQGHDVFVAEPGTHGSSMLVADRVDGPVEATWERVLEFLTDALDQGRRLAVVSRGEDRIAFVDLETGTLTPGPLLGEFPHEIAGDGGSRAYVPSYGGTTVHVLDLSAGDAVASWQLEPATALHGVAVSRDGSLVWVTAEEERAVLELDNRSGRVLRRWPTGGYRSHMVAATPDDRKLYVPNLDDGTVSVIDRSDGSLRQIETGEGPEGIGVSPSGAEVWVANRGDGTVSVIDRRTDEIIERFPTEGRFPVKLRFSPDGRYVLVANNRSGSVSLFDTESRSLLAVIPTGERPLGLAFSGDSRLGYVTRPGADEVVEIDLRSHRVTRRLRTLPNPDGILWLSRGHDGLDR